MVEVIQGFPGSSAGKESTCNSGDRVSIPGSASSPGEGIGYTLQYSWAYSRIPLQCGRPGSDPWVGKIPWRKHGNPLQCSCQENLHGQRSLAGYSPRGHKELDMTERLSTAQHRGYI